MSQTDAPDAYETLVDHVQQTTYISDATQLIGWDQQVTMPADGTPARAKQLSALSSVLHERQTDETLGEALAALEDADLTDEQAAVVRETRESYEAATRVPESLVRKRTELSAEAQDAWESAKADDTFEQFAPVLERRRELERERADHLDPDREPYRVMYEGLEPAFPEPLIESIFTDLREHLVPLIESIRASPVTLADPFEETYDEATQEALNHEALELLGYDFDRGRLDTSVHPFTSGTQFDARVTTRFDPAAPLEALNATIHEFGHATYMLGVPDEAYGTPLGEERYEIHESQSRFWENHVARTEAFWEFFTPTFNDHLGTAFDARRLFEAANRIYPNNLIRVEADELTYHMHIILRTEVERAFVAGEIDVEEIPQVWNDKMDEYLGVRPETDAEGCLQDVHWTGGFGGFQSYTIGSVAAAQLDATLREDVDDVDNLIRNGNFEPLLTWMEENVHAHGQRYTADELIEVVTGEPLTADYFLEYVDAKFGELYDL